MYLMKGMVVLAIGLVAASCNRMEFSGQPEISDEEALENAELALGFEINPNQDWNMVQNVEAKVSVSLATGKSYSYTIFSNDPLAEHTGLYLAKGTVKDGESFSANVSCAATKSQLVIGLTDENNLTFYKRAHIEDGKINVTFVNSGSQNAPALSRAIAVNNDVYDKFPSTTEVAAYFPTAIPADAKTDAELETLYRGKTLKDADGNEVVDEWGNKIWLWDLYAIYMNVVGKTEKNIKVTEAGEFSVGHSCANPANQVYNVYIAVGAGNNLTLKRQGAEHVNFYILSGNVTIDSNFGECGGIISVAAGANVIDQRMHIAHNDGVKIFNRGTYTTTNTTPYWNGSETTTAFDIGNFCTFYNEGKFVSYGGISYSPGDANDSYFMNLGDNAEVTAPSMTLNSTGNFFNSGKVNISGETKVTQARLHWINNGHYTTGSMTFSAQNTTFYNYCQLIVTGNAHMFDGEFNMMKDSYMEAGSAEMDNFIVNMKSDAGVNIKGDVRILAQGDGTYQGFKTTESGNKVLIGGKATIDAHRHALSISEGITYSINEIEIVRDGNVITEDYLLSVNDGDYPVLDLQGLECADGTFSVSPNPDGCGAVVDTVIIIISDNPHINSYAFEDTKKGDYDMNDVVLKVYETQDGDNTNYNIKLVAAGATLNLEIRLYDYVDDENTNYYGSDYQVLSYDNKTEIHEMFGVDAGTMVNTGAGASVKNFPVITIPKGTRGNNNPAKLRLAIWSQSQGEMRLAGAGQAPFGVVIPEDWKWPTERTRITSAYNQRNATAEPEDDRDQSFEKFASKENTTERAKNWYKYPTGRVMDESDILKK